ncbi:ASCH domain-containing protein [Sphingobacterium sp. UBA5996]|uniref:ASCH domain-containing protein n=1 Tax=Sphingobacterium sp. UBA5996 TaxID=1947505 RepID=UPI0025E24852|nr:ASCH domain-containing protein [Sphingobacterium sp. UBA5996]
MCRNCTERYQTGYYTFFNSIANQQRKLPAIRDLAIITDWHGIPKAVTKTVKVEIVRFKDMTDEYAFIEGEGDLLERSILDLLYARIEQA